MKVILTHEQADFDAIASLLGGYLLDDDALPVLPIRMNRNVRAFITLYGVELPFIEPRDLVNQSIDEVTLVDTQSLVSLKGMSPQLQVTVIDHHPKRENLPDEWFVYTPETGSNTTYIIELIREKNGDLTPIHATLLLLGVYEDTGSLTYTRTTPRDLLAAAYLLENGADLQIAVNFLNHPLTRSQQSLYDRLRINAESLNLQGHTIILACGDALELDEELSTIAHKLRDLLDPDALFMLVKTRSGVQMIARSTTDHIDVSAIVSRFGGGGHERASASLIRDQDLEQIRLDLLSILPDMVRPAITVAQIMSLEPQLLSLETSVEKADERMRRYGYEGFPVVKEETTTRGKSLRIVGLLTRRSVDRALAHKHYVPISSLMQEGEVFITSDDSLENLQRLMIDTGWGQVPVVDPQSKEIIGIVTRTDLIKTLSPKPGLPDRHNLIARLEGALPVEHLTIIKAISQAAVDLHTAVYIVGGFVRDLLLESPSLDFDLVVEGDAIHLAKSLSDRWGGRVTSHSQFGTAKWHLAGSNFELQFSTFPLETVDLVSARIEYYTYPTALPTVERGSIKLDLHRRDFTINTLALRLDGRHYGEIHDYYGGVNDLRQGLVRVLHSLSFVDDPTRILRAVRFEQRFGFKIEPRTLYLATEARQLIERLSGDRIRHEINHILIDPKAGIILERLYENQFLQAVHPALVWDGWLQEKFRSLPSKPPEIAWGLDSEYTDSIFKRDLSYCLLLIRLSDKEIRSICDKLKFPAKFMNQVLSAARIRREIPLEETSTPSQITNFLDEFPPFARFAAYYASEDDELRVMFENYTYKWQRIHPIITGHDLQAQGIPPGPVYKEILDQLRNLMLDGTISTEEEEKNHLSQILEIMRSNPI